MRNETRCIQNVFAISAEEIFSVVASRLFLSFYTSC
uniref:Uncharacterized protein n=1 Tax=Arundo donax TaxID=35708 RepID=A0A0A9E5R1_ARUDO